MSVRNGSSGPNSSPRSTLSVKVMLCPAPRDRAMLRATGLSAGVMSGSSETKNRTANRPASAVPSFFTVSCKNCRPEFAPPVRTICCGTRSGRALGSDRTVM